MHILGNLLQSDSRPHRAALDIRLGQVAGRGLMLCEAVNVATAQEELSRRNLRQGRESPGSGHSESPGPARPEPGQSRA